MTVSGDVEIKGTTDQIEVSLGLYRLGNELPTEVEKHIVLNCCFVNLIRSTKQPNKSENFDLPVDLGANHILQTCPQYKSRKVHRDQSALNGSAMRKRKGYRQEP